MQIMIQDKIKITQQFLLWKEEIHIKQLILIILQIFMKMFNYKYKLI
jgi:hypothetical protein